MFKNKNQQFHSNGKLLLTGEYYVLEGAKALALPTKLGQSLEVSYSPIEAETNDTPSLKWKSYDEKGEIWLEVIFDIKEKDFPILSAKEEGADRLQQILQQVQKQSPNFLQNQQYTKHSTKSTASEESTEHPPSIHEVSTASKASAKHQQHITVKTHLEFARNWGLGSSSTLISNIARWAEIDAYELLENTFGGSGYDIACALSNQPILYQKKPTRQIQRIDFKPLFQEHLYFVHLNQKQNSREAIHHFYEQDATTRQNIVLTLNEITERITKADNLATFETLLQTHEQIIADNLRLQKVKDLHFEDYWGTVKSLGAWGGDFVLATSDLPEKETMDYFEGKGFGTVLKYRDMVF